MKKMLLLLLTSSLLVGMEYQEAKVINVIAEPRGTCSNGVDFTTVIRITNSKRTKIVRCEKLVGTTEGFYFIVKESNNENTM